MRPFAAVTFGGEALPPSSPMKSLIASLAVVTTLLLWRPVADGNAPASVPQDPSATLPSDLAALQAELVATNLFVREDGAWRLVFHQAGPVHRRVERRSRPQRGGMLN